ncbi:hypothetical protein [Actinomadura sp. HBU206391]|uniref:hypothetical protein n=1 Tax=Actinomadura sp. HBU206391 TaxID=2731692 RepID=UPI00164F311A|nr:hypothetical protein [Actinomadura sp. HBU206391]MBC6463376.1 hypothetical protein [Actinomadura sp. HBU206391]
MITSFGKQVVVAATVVAFGGLTAIATQTPAQAGSFSASYTCTDPVRGARTVLLDGWLASPGQTAVSRPTGFRLNLSALRLDAPVAIGSWNASAWIAVSGAESASFRVAGSGGLVPARQPISGDLTGDWAPSVPGTDVLSVSSVTITVNTAVTGDVTVQCVPNAPLPVAETLTVAPLYQSGWVRPTVVLQPRPGWVRPVGPPYHHHHHHPGWSRPAGPQHHHHHPGWSRPVAPPHNHGSTRPITPPVRNHGSTRPITPPAHNHGSTRPITPRHHHGRP